MGSRTDRSNDLVARVIASEDNKPQIKIDYIFVSPDIEVVSADVPSIVASDHRPYVAEIKDKQ